MQRFDLVVQVRDPLLYFGFVPSAQAPADCSPHRHFFVVVRREISLTTEHCRRLRPGHLLLFSFASAVKSAGAIFCGRSLAPLAAFPWHDAR